jgi:hypothetical protein
VATSTSRRRNSIAPSPTMSRRSDRRTSPPLTITAAWRSTKKRNMRPPSGLRSGDQAQRQQPYYFNNRGFALRNNSETTRRLPTTQSIKLRATTRPRTTISMALTGSAISSATSLIKRRRQAQSELRRDLQDRGILYYDKKRYDPSSRGRSGDQNRRQLSISFNKQGSSYEQARGQPRHQESTRPSRS